MQPVEIIQMDQRSHMELRQASRGEKMYRQVMASELDKEMEVECVEMPRLSQQQSKHSTDSHLKTLSSRQISRRRCMGNPSRGEIKVAQDRLQSIKARCAEQIKQMSKEIRMSNTKVLLSNSME